MEVKHQNKWFVRLVHWRRRDSKLEFFMQTNQKNMLVFPGGEIEKGEEPLVALAYELSEETSMTTEQILTSVLEEAAQEAGDYHFDWGDGNKDCLLTITGSYFAARLETLFQSDDPDVQDVGWFCLDDLLTLHRDRLYPNVEGELRMLAQSRLMRS